MTNSFILHKNNKVVKTCKTKKAERLSVSNWKKTLIDEIGTVLNILQLKTFVKIPNRHHRCLGVLILYRHWQTPNHNGPENSPNSVSALKQIAGSSQLTCGHIHKTLT